MQARPHVLGQQDVAGDDRLLGDRRPAGQAKLAGQSRFVHLRALGQGRVLAVLGDHAVEGLDVLEGATHEDRIGDALAVVGKDTHLGARAGHRTQRRKMLAFQPLGNSTDGTHFDPVGCLAQIQHLVDDGSRILRRCRIRHRVHGGVASHGGRTSTGEDGLGILAAGLAQVGMNIHEAGQGD